MSAYLYNILARLIAVVFIGVAIYVGVWAQPDEDVAPEPSVTYYFSGDNSYPPYEFLDKQGKPTGFNVELLQAISRTMGFKVEINLMPWSDARCALDAGRIDGITGMFYSLERDKAYDFSVPHSTVQYVIFARRGEGKDIHTPKDLLGRKVLFQRGDIMQDWLDQSGLNVIRFPVEAPIDALRRLAFGEGDCALLGRLPALYLTNQSGIDNVIAVGDTQLSQDFCYAVRPDTDRLLQMINEGLKTVKESGEYEGIANRWFGVLDENPLLFWDVIRGILWILVPLVALLLISLLWTWLLRKQVRQRTLDLNKELSERKRVENALRQSQAHLQAIADNTSAIVTLCDRNGCLIMANRQMEIIFKATGDPSPVGHYLDELFTPQTARTLLENNEAVFKAGHPMQFEETVLQEGEEHTYIAVKVPLPDDEGGFYAICCIATDITDIKKAEQERLRMEAQIREAQKFESLGVMAGGIAHDFNNLLMGVMGYADMVAQELPKTSPLQRYLSQIETASRRAADLCSQMLAYAGKGKFKVQIFSLSGLIDEMAELLRVSISRNARLELIKSDEPVAIEADNSQIRQVILNLIINASEALGENGGNITVKTGLADERVAADLSGDPSPDAGAEKYVMLEVIDDGVGMDSDLRAKIFEPFFSTKFTGRGLGLSAVQGIVSSHRGLIRVESRPSKGTTFRVLLPMARQPLPVAPALVSQPGESWKGDGQVLVVDDEPVVLDVAAMALSMAGLTVLKANDGEEAVLRLNESPGQIALVLLDLTMPGISGMETLKILREIEPDIRVLLTSGYSEEEAISQLNSQSISGFIQKPYRPSDLIEKVKLAFEGHVIQGR